ncbi:MAG: hypothetical protein WBF76_00965, partial [Pseudonocardiaceae bacterium]
GRLAIEPPGDIRRVGTMLSTSLEDGTPIEQIAAILGHQSVRSTGVYLKSSLGLLAKCALDPDGSASEATR